MRKEFDVSAVVTGDADRPDVFLYRGPGDVAGAAVIAEIDDFDAVADEFQIDGADGAVMPVAHGDSREQADWVDVARLLIFARTGRRPAASHCRIGRPGWIDSGAAAERDRIYWDVELDTGARTRERN